MQAAILGYNPKKWQTEIEIRVEARQNQNCTKIVIPPPAKGKHSFSYCDDRLVQGHSQIHGESRMGPTDPDSQMAGITRFEIFPLLDTTQARSGNANHVKDQEAVRRAKKERAKEQSPKEREKESMKEHDDATTKPILREEFAKFKAIMSCIAMHEAMHGDAKIFRTEQWQILRTREVLMHCG